MANEAAWQSGWQMGAGMAQARRAHKQALSDEEFEQHAGRLAQQLADYRGKLATINAKQNPSEFADIQQQMGQTLGQIRQSYHPDHRPDAVAKFGHILTDKIGLSNPQQRIRKEAARRSGLDAQNEQEAEHMAQAAPSAPDEWGKFSENYRRATGAQPTPEVAKEWMERQAGITEKPALKLYTLADGNKAWLDASRPDLIPPGSTAASAETEGTRTRADFAAYQKTHPEFQGTFEQWKKQQTAAPGYRWDAGTGQVVNPQTGRRYSRTDANLPADVTAIFSSQKESAQEKQKNAVALAYARGTAIGGGRYVQVVNPETGDTNYMRASDAAKAKVGTPQSNAYKLDLAVSKAFAVGQPAQTLNYFNTATEHLKMLAQAADALDNGDVQLFNRVGNAWATATGSPAPTNFETVKAAVAGELSKTFKGQGATDQEIALINEEINLPESPAQLHGAIEHNLALMGSKLNALKGQYEAGRAGQPNFPGAGVPPTPGDLKRKAQQNLGADPLGVL